MDDDGSLQGNIFTLACISNGCSSTTGRKGNADISFFACAAFKQLTVFVSFAILRSRIGKSQSVSHPKMNGCRRRRGRRDSLRSYTARKMLLAAAAVYRKTL